MKTKLIITKAMKDSYFAANKKLNDAENRLSELSILIESRIPFNAGDIVEVSFDCGTKEKAIVLNKRARLWGPLSAGLTTRKIKGRKVQATHYFTKAENCKLIKASCPETIAMLRR